MAKGWGAVPVTTVLVLVMAVVTKLLSESLFGRPRIMVTDFSLSCFSLLQPDTASIQLAMSLEVGEARLALSSTPESEGVQMVEISALYWSHLDMTQGVVFPQTTLSGSQLQNVSTTGGPVEYGVPHSVVYESTVVATPASNLMAYDLSQEQLDLTVQIRLRFDCENPANVSSCRKVVYRSAYHSLSSDSPSCT